MLERFIMSYVTDDVLKKISGFDTTRDAWIKLENSYASESKARAIQVREELQSFKKGNLKYMLRIKLLANKLDSVGCGLNEE